MRRSPLLTAVVVLSAWLAAPRFVCAQADFRIVRTFEPSRIPRQAEGLVAGPDGNFYGFSTYGGSHNNSYSGNGTIFRVTPGGAVTVLHEFNGDDGYWPNSLILASDGSFYGTAQFGDATGNGNVFRITVDGSLTVLYSFKSEEGFPRSPIFQRSDGDFYGTSTGGFDNGGTVYKITAAGQHTILRAFDGHYGSTDPQQPYGPLIEAADGNFYGLTQRGGIFNYGTFFKMSRAGAVTVLHHFTSTEDGRAPDSLFLARDGHFYAPHFWYGGHGAILRITPLGDVSLVFAFTGDERGEQPSGALIEAPDGSIFGSTTPIYSGSGPPTVFKMAPDHTVSLVHPFDGWVEGAGIHLGFLRAADGNLYGVAAGGGLAGRGTVFKLTPAGALAVLTAFPGNERGFQPSALTRASDGTIYGVTREGGTLNRGTIFTFAPDTGSVTWLHSFGDGEGRGPSGLVEGHDGYLYGTSGPDRGDQAGFAFRASRTGVVTTLHAFDSATEGIPGPLIQGLDGNLYGTSYTGGESNKGTVIRMTPAGIVTVLHAFRGGETDGASPSAPLVQGRDGTLYGTTSGGGTTGFGTVFKITADGSFSILRSVYAHDGDYSANIMPGVTMASDGNLYGVVPHGKYYNSEAFRLTPDGVYTLLFNFRNNGFVPNGPPFQAPDGNLYGVDPPAGYSSPPANLALYKFGLGDGHYENLIPTGDEVYWSPPVPGGDGYLYGLGSAESGDSVVFRLELPMPALMTIDAPGPSPATVAQPFSFSGWALDLGPSPSGGSGIDAVHVWAFPDSGAAPMFVGAAIYGLSRPDVAAAFGSSRFTSSGFGLDVQGLSAGGYRLDAFAHSTRTGTFTVARSVSIAVPSPQMAIDAPVAGGTLPPAFTLSGWALDPAAASGTGIDAVHVYAYPQAGSAAVFLGVASYGASRPDVGAIFGARFTNSGFSLASGLAPGAYRLAVFIHGTASGVFTAQTRDITIRAGNPLMFVDAPAINAVVSQPFTIRGWAVDTDAPSSTGVDAIHVWAFASNGTPVFLGAASYGLARPDVGAYLGASRFTSSGYSLSATGLSPGVWQLVVFARSTVTGTFNQARVVPITVH